MLQDFLMKIEKYRFNKSVEKIKKTKPVKYIYNEEIKIVSMVGKDSIHMYLLSIKSFMSNFGYGSIEIINDGTLTQENIETLKYHLPKVTVCNAQNIDTKSCPNYISWRRLFRIAELIETSYVIQLDSDIIVTGPLAEVDKKVSRNSGFVIGGSKWPIPVDTKFLHAIVSQWNNNHVQSQAELHFKNLDFFKSGTTYLRGCAGFAGYPKNSFTKSDLIELSTEIENSIGKEQWHKWGSEQTATLCLISKSYNASILPWPQYQNYRFPVTNESYDSILLTHFIGSNRFKDSTYRKLCSKYIKSQLDESLM